MAFYVGQKKEHKDGKFSFWITDLSLDSFFTLGKVIVVFLGILALLAAASPVLGLLINFGIVLLVVRFIFKLFRK